MTEPTVERGKVISLTYTLHDEKGELFEYSDLPISYLHGSGVDLFDKIEQSIEGHKIGDSLEVILTPADGFGVHDPSLTFNDELVNVPPQFQKLGAEVEAQNDRGESMKFLVTNIDKENGVLTVDGNHPLAGQTVKFNVKITEIRDATADELKNGTPENKFGPTLQ